MKTTSLLVRRNARGFALTGLHPKNVPGHVWAEVFAADLAAGRALNLWAAFGRNSALSAFPLTNSSWRHLQQRRQCSSRTNLLNGALDWGKRKGGVCVHARTLATLNINVKPC